MSTKFWIDNKIYLVDNEVEEYIKQLQADKESLKAMLKKVKDMDTFAVIWNEPEEDVWDNL